MTDIVIASAARTPVGAFNGGLAGLAAHQLGNDAPPRPQAEPHPTAAEQADFAARYDAKLRRAYPRRANGKTFFPFRRLFLVARG